jgi:hypothetical protein
MKANGVNVLKILTFGPIRVQRNLTFGQSGIVRKFKGGMNLKLTSFEKPNARGSLVYTLEVTSCVRVPKLAVNKMFSRAHPYIKQICIFQHREII